MSSSKTTRSRGCGPVLPAAGGFKRSVSPPDRFCSSSPSDSFASSSSGFSSPVSFFKRSISPSRVSLYGAAASASPSVRISIHRSTSPSRPISVFKPGAHSGGGGVGVGNSHHHHHHHSVSLPKKTCMCSPTTHPGSFRCSLHKNASRSHSHGGFPYPSNRLNARRSAMTNSLVRIGSVEGEWVKRALTALIRPSSHQQRRRAGFHPRPSRLSAMSKADDP